MKVHCPICRTEIDFKTAPFRPFCSEDCKKRDLGNWATERYRIAGQGSPERDESSEGGRGEE